MSKADLSPLATYVGHLSDDEIVSIINDWEQYSKEGTCGDNKLRHHATEVMKQSDVPHAHIIPWMTMLAMECFRHFALAHISIAAHHSLDWCTTCGSTGLDWCTTCGSTGLDWCTTCGSTDPNNPSSCSNGFHGPKKTSNV